MKLLAWHCESLRYKDERPSTRPPGIHPREPTKSNAEHEDVLLIFVSVEKGDTAVDAVTAASVAAELTTQNGARNGCVIMPFAHLSQKLAPPEDARDLLASLFEEVRSRGCEVTLASFGFHKLLELSMTALGHPGSVAYREI